ncbi:MAG TPA: hypothetical protein VN785_06700 [Candidatus Angelobacter sp.]|nr:hypothetical protein [Candidatus Angelobacter sp.]
MSKFRTDGSAMLTLWIDGFYGSAGIESRYDGRPLAGRCVAKADTSSPNAARFAFANLSFIA